MAYRTTSAEVQEIVDVESGVDLEPFIIAANELVTECCAGQDYSDTRLAEIERWLAAHFYCIRDARAVSERAGSVGQTLQSKVDLGFDVTHYGQMAMRLDTEGGLAALNERIKTGKRTGVSVTWLGTENPDA